MPRPPPFNLPLLHTLARLVHWVSATFFPKPATPTPVGLYLTTLYPDNCTKRGEEVPPEAPMSQLALRLDKHTAAEFVKQSRPPSSTQGIQKTDIGRTEDMRTSQLTSGRREPQVVEHLAD